MGQNISQQTFLRDKYKERQSCKFAVNASAAGMAADAFNAEGVQNMSDTVGGLALMRCVGMSYTSIILYHIVLICIVIACIIAIPPAIPDRIWENCRICTRYEQQTYKDRRCVEYRQGTPRECKEQGKISEYVVATIVGILIVVIISNLFLLHLKSKVYTTEGFIGEQFARTIL